MHKNIMFILLTSMMVLSVLLISNGITGFAVMEPGIKEVCSKELLCEEPEVCCYFYGEEEGVCNSEDKCEKILELTKDQQFNSDMLEQIIYGRISGETQLEQEEKLATSYTTQIMFGTLLFIIAILNVLLYIENTKGSKKTRS